MPQKRRINFISVALVCCLCLIGCANRVLSPDAGDSSGLRADDSPPAPQDAAVSKLGELLRSKGYMGLGLRYENPKTVDLLTRLFSDSRTSDREIATIYTGMGMSYDPQYKSLTVGGSDFEAMIRFIEKHVPAKAEITKTQ